MNITNSTQRARWKKRVQKWSRNCVAAKERKRLSRDEWADYSAREPDEINPCRYATVSIRIGRESSSFRVFRFDETRLVMRGKAQAASTIGKRIALVLENLI